MIECHLSVMSQQTTTATNRASVMHAVIHAWYIPGLISRSVYIAIADSGPRGPRYIGATLYIPVYKISIQYTIPFKRYCTETICVTLYGKDGTDVLTERGDTTFPTPH